LPSIDVADRQLRDISAAAVEAITRLNDPPQVFRHGGVLVRLQVDGPGAVRLSPLVGKHLCSHLARVADWFADGTAIPPPAAVIRDLEATQDVSDIPFLESVATCPVLTREGEIVTQPGYHRRGRVWYQPDPGLVIPPIPSHPSAADVIQARAFIEDNLFVDFPFLEDSDRAVAWAALTLPFVRLAIDGSTPLHLLTAPTRGTGKTLLATVLTVPVMGRREVELMTVDCEEPEMRKRLTGKLLNSPMFVFMDNLGQGRRLVSSSLAAVLTARAWSDRLLRSSIMVSLPVRCVWLATGNNPVLSDELMRRTVRSRLDSGQSRPHMRSDFKHPKLLAWTKENRSALLQAILTLVQAWLEAGMPRSDVRLGMFESWAQVIGGILDVAGVPGLRQAIERDQSAETDLEQAIGLFFLAWWEQHGSAAVGVKDLYRLAIAAECLEEVLSAHLPGQQRGRDQANERSKQTRLGLALGRLTGQVLAGFRLQEAGKDRSGRRTYRLMPAQG
jgi:hypothetical protein